MVNGTDNFTNKEQKDLKINGTAINTPDELVGEIFHNASTTQLHGNILVAPEFLKSLLDYNPFLSIISLLSLVYGALYKNTKKARSTR